MPEIALGVTYSKRTPAQTPQVFLNNLVLEKTLTNQIDQKSWIGRPGFLEKYTIAGALRGITDSPIGFLVADTGFFYISGITFYFQPHVGGPPSVLGTILGNDYVIFATTPTAMLICGAGKAYRYDGTFTTIVMPGAEPVAWVAYMAGYFLLGVAESQKIFFMVPGAAAPVALDFFSAQVQGDNTVRGVVLGDQLVIFSDKHTEFWVASGDADLPFSRTVGQLYSKGLASVHAIAPSLDNSIYFVGNDRVVYRAAAQPIDVGDPSISEALRNADPDEIICWSFKEDDHAYFVMTLETLGTFVLDVSTGAWSPWSSFGNPEWAMRVGFQFRDATILAGSKTLPRIYEVSAEYPDDNLSSIICTLTGGVPIVGPPKRCDNLTLIMDPGVDSLDYDVALRCSDDQGQTFSPTLVQTVLTGNFVSNPVWRQLGLMRQPMRVFQFMWETNGFIRVSTARYNESFVY